MKVSQHFLAFLAGTIVALVQLSSGAESNCDDNSKLQYEAGKSYVYKINLVTYDSEERFKSKNNRNHQAETNRVKAKIITTGNVVLTALENCEYVLTLNKVDQEGEADREYSPVPLTVRAHSVPRASVKFTFKNGEISALHAAETGREPWVDNILRGLLTMIQNKAMSNTDGEQADKETNIKGDCVVHVRIPEEGTYKKHINSEECSEALISPMADGISYTAPIYARIPGQHSRFSKAHVRCFQKVKDGLLTHVNCTEDDEVPIISHRMISDGTIQLVNETAQDPSSVGGATSQEISTLVEKISIVYDTRRNILGTGENFFQSIVNMIKTMYSDHNANKAEYYLKLKDILASVQNFDQLEQTIEKTTGDDMLQGQFAKNIIREVATEVGSEAAVVYLANLVNNNKLEWGTMLAFYSKLAFSRDPTLKGLAALATNVEMAWSNFQNDTFIAFHFGEKKRIRKVMLGASAYAYQYCRRQQNGCVGVAEYESLISKISEFCSSKQPEISPACAQALGNVEYLPPAAVNVVKKLLIATRDLITGNTKKIIAFDAFRRDPCQPELKQLARENLENSENPHDLRMVAYLAVARCPQEEDLAIIDRILENEYHSPVSSFIASHVYNLMDSQSPSKFYVKNTPLSQIGIPAKVPTVHNSSNSSRFVEYSTYRPESDLGFSADAHYIFKEDGSEVLFAHVNVTIDALGKSYNSLQVGISKRYLPSSKKLDFFLKRAHAQWVSSTMIPAFFAVDTYYRMFGTTISMGIDVLDEFKPHEFFDKFEDKEVGLLRLDLVKPFTLMEKELVFPTFAGIPLTLQAQAAYLPIISMNHTGNPNGLGLFDLLTKWDEKSGQFRHDSLSDGSFIGKVSVAAGKGTPVSFGYNVEAKIHCNHSIGYESIKNQSTNWLKKVEFPEKTLWSKRFSLGTRFTMNHWANEEVNWPVLGDMEQKDPHKFADFGGMGLKFTGELVKGKSLFAATDISLKVEKTEDSFTGYSLDIEAKPRNEHGRKYDVKLRADGLSTEDTLHFTLEHEFVHPHALENDDDRPKSELTVSTDISSTKMPSTGFRFHYASIGFPKSELNLRSTVPELEVSSIMSIATMGIAHRSSYAMQFETWYKNKKMPLLDWTVSNGKDSGEATLKFQGPMEASIGTVIAKVTNADQRQNEITIDLSQESQKRGKNSLNLFYTSENGEVIARLNTTANIRGKYYHLNQLIPKRELNEQIDESGQRLLSRQEGLKYIANYHDSDSIKVDLSAGFDQNFQPTYVLNNGSITITGSRIRVPFVAKASLYQDRDRSNTEVHDGLQRWFANLYMDVFGHKQAEFMHDHNYTETAYTGEKHCNGKLVSEGQRCAMSTIATNIFLSDKFEFNSSFTNDSPTKTEMSIRLHHSHPDFGGDLKVDINRPEENHGMKIFKTTVLNLDHIPKHGEKWHHTANTEVDLEKRTLVHSSTTQKNPGQKEWTVKMNSTWPENLLDGDSTLNLAHTCPRKKTFALEVLNQARQPKQAGEIFNNTLTATVDLHGTSREFTPKKQFIWFLTSDKKSDIEKYDYTSKTTNDIRVVNLEGEGGGQDKELFRVKDYLEIMKLMSKEGWTLKGQGSAFKMGKEIAFWDYDTDFNIEQQYEHANEIVHSPKSTFKFRGDGWFESEQSLQELRNNTWSSRVNTKATMLKELHLTEDITFVYKKLNQPTGECMLSVDVEGKKEIKFKDMLHFSKHMESVIKVSNKTTTIVEDIVVNGPHLTVLIKSDAGNETEDSYVIDFAGGIYEEKHQHKFNLRSGSNHHRHHHHRHHHHHHHHGETSDGSKALPTHNKFTPRRHGIIKNIMPVGNFNFTISK